MTKTELKDAVLIPLLSNKRELINAVIMILQTIMIAICVCDVPYVYIELVRIFALGVFSWLSYCSFKKQNDVYGFVLGFLAVLFQPLFKVNLGDALWIFVDILVVLLLSFLSFRQIVLLIRKSHPDYSFWSSLKKKSNRIKEPVISTFEYLQLLHQYDDVINVILSCLRGEDSNLLLLFDNEQKKKGSYLVQELANEYPKEYEITFITSPVTVIYPRLTLCFSCLLEDSSLVVHFEESNYGLCYPPKPYLGSWFYCKKDSMYLFARSVCQTIVDYYANYHRNRYAEF